MNLLHIKYAIEVAKTKSISKAAENLFTAQPNLSRAIKDLEESLGIVIFNRNTKGITVTPDGEEFLQYTKKIITQIDQVEDLYKNGKRNKQTFSVCVPRATYISNAFAEFSKNIDTSNPAEIFYKETNSMRTIKNVVNEEYNLGIIRYQTVFEKYFKDMFNEKKLISETITEFSYQLVMSKDHPLANKDDILLTDLSDYIEINHADPYVPSMPTIDVKKAELSEHVDKRIFIFDRASQFTLLSNVPNTFMWLSPLDNDMLCRYGLVSKDVKENKKIYKDVLIYRKNYKLSDLDKFFISAVCDEKRKVQN